MAENFYVYSAKPIFRVGQPIVVVATKTVPEANAILAEWYLYIIAEDRCVHRAFFGRTPDDSDARRSGQRIRDR
jgi:hypothetical protein